MKFEKRSNKSKKQEKEYKLDKTFVPETIKSKEDIVFGHFVCKEIEKEFTHDLFSLGVSEEVVEDLKNKLSKYSVQDRKRILAWPKELRESDDENSFLNKQVEKLIETNDSKTFLENLLNTAKSKNFNWTIGYHLSDKEIERKNDGSWNINPTEKDHRDEDMPKAYYSLNYEHLYREKNKNPFLYLVRGSYDDKHDDVKQWYRNNYLSIIQKIKLSEVEKQVKDFISKDKNTDIKDIT